MHNSLKKVIGVWWMKWKRLKGMETLCLWKSVLMLYYNSITSSLGGYYKPLCFLNPLLELSLYSVTVKETQWRTLPESLCPLVWGILIWDLEKAKSLIIVCRISVDFSGSGWARSQEIPLDKQQEHVFISSTYTKHILSMS